MATNTQHTIGAELENQLFQALEEADRAPLPGARSLPILHGPMPKGGFTQPQENVLVRATQILAQSGRIYSYGDTKVMQTDGLADNPGVLTPLRTGSIVEAGANDLLANIFVCQQGEHQFSVPPWFAKLLLRSELLSGMLPRIRLYSTRPIFDNNYILRGPGWHPEVGILINGPEIEPIIHVPAGGGVPAIDRLPPHLRALLGRFCFRSDADVANTIAFMLTGLLLTHFVQAGKPIAIVDGNQPGLGKTLLVRAIAVLLDDIEPSVIHFIQNDEELAKRMCATLRGCRQTVLLIDNAKVGTGSVVSSPAIEANSMAPQISLRILGKSENLTRPNDILWALTMNDTRTSPDLVSRALPIQLAYEGRPEDRDFGGFDPIVYVRAHRQQILGELAGMIVYWQQQGRPPGHRSHRLPEWAAVIGGIVETAGLPEFLANAETAAASFDPALDELVALAEAVITNNGPYTELNHNGGN